MDPHTVPITERRFVLPLILVTSLFFLWALSLKNLGSLTKLGSSLLMMSIIGGAVCPAIMGIVSDASDIQHAFVVPLVCYIYVLYFAARGYRPAAPVFGGQRLEVTSSEIE